MPTYLNEGDALKGERIAFQARRIDKGPLVHGSSEHRLQTGKLRTNAYCVIEKAFRSAKKLEK